MRLSIDMVSSSACRLPGNYGGTGSAPNHFRMNVPGRPGTGRLGLTIFRFPVKASREREFLVMRGLMMALFALDFPGHDGALTANHWAGRIGVPFLSNTTKAKTITTKTAFAKKTGKTV